MRPLPCFLFRIETSHIGFGVIFYLGLAAAALTAVYQLYLCKDRDRQGCSKAFLNNIWFGGFVFAGLFLTYAFGITDA